jgi:hypothetical protein
MNAPVYVPVFYVKNANEDLIKLDQLASTELLELANMTIERAMQLGVDLFSRFLSLRKSMNEPTFGAFLFQNRDSIILNGNADTLREVCRYLDVNSLGSYRDFLTAHHDYSVSKPLQGIFSVVIAELANR